MSQLEDLLQQCTVKLSLPGRMGWGTGFFVAPGWILTCAHVVQEAKDRPVQVRWQKQENWAEAVVEKSLPEPYDLALLRVALPPNGNPPCVYLDEAIQSRDPLYLFGYPDQDFPNGCPVTFHCEGLTGDEPPLIKFALGQVRPGMSGSPLLNQRTGKVCGVVKFTRDRSIDLGGGAIPTSVILAQLPELRELQRVFHEGDQRWSSITQLTEALNSSSSIHGGQATNFPTTLIQSALAKLNNVPNLPPHFLFRSSELEAVKAIVLNNNHQTVALTGTTHRVGLQGMGGIGKSVLATAIARDEDVRKLFSDGIFWLPIGQTPQLTTWQSYIANAFGDTQYAFTDEELGKAYLRDLLSSKACLLILDDVWCIKDIAAFDALGQYGQLLITTRDASLINSINACKHEIGVLEDEQALILLAHWAHRAVESLPVVAHQIVQECENLPLAVAMIGAMMQGKFDERWNNVLHRLQNADLDKIRMQFSNYPYPNLLKAIQVSVEALDPNTQARYLDFAVFREDTQIPERALQTFWTDSGLNEYDIQDLIDELVNKSLLRRDDQGNLNLHDLLLDYLRKQANNLPTLHARLLNAYSELCPEGWHSGPRDGYFFNELAYHLVEADRQSELKALLLDFRWLRTKLQNTNITALIADFQFLPTDSNTQLVKDTLRLSAHVLLQDKLQLVGQLTGRLPSFKIPGIHRLLDYARQYETEPWLRPLTPTLLPPGGRLLRTFTHHGGKGAVLAVSPDGKYVISACDDYTIRVWDFITGQETYKLIGHTKDITALAVTPNSQVVISASEDKTLKTWSLNTGCEIFTMQGHLAGITAITLTVSGMRVISASEDGIVKLWSLRTGKEIPPHIQIQEMGLSLIKIAPDGRTLVGAVDTRLRVWNLQTGNCLLTLKGHLADVTGLIFTPKIPKLVSSSLDGSIKIWSLAESLTGNKMPLTFSIPNESFTSLTLTPNGQHAIIGSRKGNLEVRSLLSGQKLFSLSVHSDAVLALATTSDSQVVVSASADKTIKLWSLGNRNPLLDLYEPYDHHAHSKSVSAVAVSANYAVSASVDKSLKIWELHTRREKNCFEAHDGAVYALAYLSKGQRIISGAADRTVRVWCIETAQRLRTLRMTGGQSYIPRESQIGSVKCVATSPDGQWIAAGSSDGIINVWSAKSAYPIVIKTNSREVQAIKVTHDSSSVIVGLSDGSIRAWRIKTGNPMFTLRGHSGAITALAITLDDKWLISGSTDSTLKIWDLITHTRIRDICAHNSQITSISIFPFSRKIASTSFDHSLKIWNIDTWELITGFTADRPFIDCAASEDGETIVAGDDLGQVYFFRLENMSL